MIKEKVSSDILDRVSSQNAGLKGSVFVASEDFGATKKFLKKHNISFVPYRFANCFCVEADYDDINILSTQDFVKYISSDVNVQTQSEEQNFINIDKLTENVFLGQNQTICFIDTGVSPHFDFIFPKSKIVKFIDLVNGETLPYDDNGHGTFVCGVAVGNGIIDKNHQGFAPLARMISIKALDRNGNSNSNRILDAMEWVFQNHKAYNIGVVCMSFGALSDNEIDPLSRGAEALWKRGIVVVAAAGNSGPKTETIMSPGKSPYIITVGALDMKSLKTADFSSRGPTIYGHKPDLLAPAVNVVSCSNLDAEYTNMSGTSVATPIVAGICAIIKCRYPKMTNSDIKQFLIKHCKKITGNPDIEGAGYLQF